MEPFRGVCCYLFGRLSNISSILTGESLSYSILLTEGRKCSMPRNAYNEERATQAAAKFICLHGGEMNYMKLGKEMYILEQHAIRNWGYSIFHDELFWLKDGPILSRTLDLIRSNDVCASSQYWKNYISRHGKYNICTINEPETSRLAEAIRDEIEKIYNKFKNYTWIQIRNWCHDNLPENKHIDEGRELISIEDLFTSADTAYSISAVKEIESLESLLDVIPGN